MPPVSRGFRRRESDNQLPADRVPPGQHLVDDFPVLTIGPTPQTPLAEWSFEIVGAIDEPLRWSWEEFQALPPETITRDIHCVTSWSKLDTEWEGVSVDTLLDGVETAAEFVVGFCDGGYETNLPLEDVTDGQAWVAFAYGGEPLPATFADIEVELSDGVTTLRFPLRAYFHETADDSDDTLVLGHSGFLEFFTASFIGEEFALELSPNDYLPTHSEDTA